MIDDHWLGAQLKARGMVSQGQLEAANRNCAGDLSQGLIATGAIREPDLLKFLGLYFQTRYVTTEKLSESKIAQWVLDLVPIESCERHLAIPVRCDQATSELSLVCTDPSNAELREEMMRTSHMKQVRCYVALRHAVEAAIRRSYRGDIHAFARIDQSLRQNYSELMNIYEQRLIDFEQDPQLAGAQSGHGQALDLSGSGEVELQVTHEPAAAMDLGSALLTPTQQALPAVSDARSDVDSLESLSKTKSPTSSGHRSPTSSEGLQLEAYIQIITVLTNLLESSDGWRRGHSVEVARLAVQVGEKLGLDARTVQLIRLTALLHELGKPIEPHLTLPSIEASAENRALARKLFNTPAKLLETAQLPVELEQILDSLYERLDGNGVPGKRSIRDLPIGARVIAAADAFCDVSANPRSPGGRSDDPEVAAQRLRESAQHRGLDAEIVAVICQVASEAQRQRARGHRVLVVDSEVGATTVLEQKLLAAGYEVRLVRTTAEAAMVVLSEKVDLVLSEVRLEPVDGFVFLERLRSDPRTQDLPFIFVSERTDVEDVNRGFELGALDYIVKPFAPEVLVAKIRRVLDQPAGRR